jgi:hypothetical protein
MHPTPWFEQDLTRPGPELWPTFEPASRELMMLFEPGLVGEMKIFAEGAYPFDVCR